MNAIRKLQDDARVYIARRGAVAVGEFLLVSTGEQKLFHIQGEKILDSYRVSTSQYGAGNDSGSNKTPLGLHRVQEKHGAGAPLFGRLVGRVFSGQIATVYRDQRRSEEDEILSRILWLGGLEEGLNKGAGVDSYERYIYIHGTAEEGRLGTASSHGCIRMKNEEIVALYPHIKIGTLVLIV